MIARETNAATAKANDRWKEQIGEVVQNVNTELLREVADVTKHL